MGIVHQESGFTFTIEASFEEPPYVYVTKGKGYIFIRIEDPQTGLPHVDEYKRVSRDDVDAAYNIVWTYQEKFMNIWERNHNFAGRAAVLSSSKRNGRTSKRGEKAMEEIRMPLKPRAGKERIKEALGGIFDKRFMPLQKRLIKDLAQGHFKSINLGSYLRLGSWAHTGGSYVKTMGEVEALCEALFGYVLPEKIGGAYFKEYRYSSWKSLGRIGPAILKYHEDRLKKLKS